MGHYYKQNGEPCYFVPNAKGTGTRDTTIRDARKLNLVPSVTEIMKIADKPGLNKWLIDQHIMAALTLPREEGWDDETFIKKVRQDASEQALKARDKGTMIHDVIERHYLGQSSVDDLYEYDMLFKSITKSLDSEFGLNQWIPEKSFSSPLGYGGKCDIHSPVAVVDFKTTDKDLDGVKCYAEHQMQGAAYKHGLGLKHAVTANLFINSNTYDVKLIIHDETERHWEMFKCLLKFWQLSKGYDSSFNLGEKA